MKLIVQKYGGSSVTNAEAIKKAASKVIKTKEEGNQVVVVVSAMGSRTDELIKLATELTDSPEPREMDMLLSTGERETMSLMAMYLKNQGHDAISLTGSQAGILTTSKHGQAEIEEITGDRVKEGIESGKVVIVAGFQGFNRNTREITTLGRGGSDATAVALAAALNADICEIYTDVQGVFTSDPRIVKGAKLIKEITYEEMLEMSSSGAKVLMARSVEFGRRYNIPIKVSSTFTEEEGTVVKDKVMEQAIISGVTHNDREIKFTLFGVPDQPGIAAKVFKPLSEMGVNVDMIVQNVSKENKSDISFTAPYDHMSIVQKTLNPVVKELGGEGLDTDKDIARVSLIGAGMKSESGTASKMFETLGQEQINIKMISTSPIRISCVIDKKNVKKALKVLHKTFIEVN